MMKLVQEFIFLKSKALSHRLMIQDGDSTISYMQMDEFTNCLAKLLISRGVLQHDRVALLIPKSINLFKAIFSILKADCGYVPLNISAPISRNKNIIERSQCKKILCTNETEDYAKELIDWNENLTVNLINLDSIDLTSYAPSKLKYKNSPNDLAYLIFTSGSTGAPKGVMISHENILNYAKWASHFFCIQPSDRVSHIPNISFDLSVFDIFPTFISGASLHLVPNSVLSFPIEISRYIDRNKLTIFNAVPSQLALMARFRALDIDLLSSLRAVTFNGEVMPAKILIEWMAACPNARFVNQYGPTETTCASLFYEIKEVPVCSTKSIPIGKPIDNTYVYVLDRDGELIGGNEVGTLYISGKGVGIGYLDGEKHKKPDLLNKITARSIVRVIWFEKWPTKIMNLLAEKISKLNLWDTELSLQKLNQYLIQCLKF